MSHTFSPFRLLLVTTLFHFCFCNRKFDGQLCIDDERQALLEFKHGIIDQADRLASWVGDKSDCCTWDGIACDNSTGHVHQIRLPGLDGHCYNYQHYRLYDACIEASKLYQLRGDLNPSLLQLKQLRHLDLSCNDFGGMQVPSFISSLGNLRYLDLSNSGFGGVIPSQLGNISKLHVLSLGNYINDIDNPYELTSVPNMQWLSSLHLLTHLDMRGVNLSKTSNWFQVINTLPSFKLHLSRCELSHIEPYVHAHNLTSLTLLDLSCNNFSSSVPWWIFSITNPVYLDLSDCHFRGPIPSDTGNIPRCINNFSIFSGKEDISIDEFAFYVVFEGATIASDLLVTKGREDTYSTILELVMLFDLSSNNLFGSIPSELTTLVMLKSLNLSRNQLTGKIPEKIGDMKKLESFDLSLNRLSGELPVSLSELSFLSSFNVSYNNLTGRIPKSTQLQSFNESSFYGNKLCGYPLTEGCVRVELNGTKAKGEYHGSDSTDWGLIVSIVSGFVVGFWIILAPLIINRAWRIEYFHFLTALKYMVYDVVRK